MARPQDDVLTLTRISIDHAQDMLYWVCRDGTIADVNKATCDRLGYSREELLAMKITAVDPSITQESYATAWEELRRRGSVTLETEHRRRDGELIPVEVSRNLVEHEGREYNCAFARDIADRKEAELRIDHLNRVLEAIRKVNQLIIREKDPARLVAQACGLLVETRGYTNAWIFLSEGPLGEACMVEQGLGADFIPLAERFRAGTLPLCCVDARKRTGVVIREPFTCGDCPLAQTHQPKEVMTTQLSHEGRDFGFICISMPSAFTGLMEEQRLFQDVANDIAFALNRIRLERERDRAVQHRVALSRKVLVAQEEERSRISRELHDELGQILTALHFELDMLGHRTTDAGAVRDGLHKADLMVKEAMSELRRLCRGLRPPLLDDLGVVPAIRALVTEFEERMEIPVRLDLHADHEGIDTSTEVAVCVFRVLQEALNNVARHSDAGRVTVNLFDEGQALRLEVHDDGRGFAPDSAGTTGFGIQGMRERADLVDGVLDIRSGPGQGARVTLRVAKGGAR
jgi:PAS domain S-box-containing protein